MNTPNPIRVYDQIKSAYLRYIDTAFWLRDAALMTERRALLERNKFIFTDVLLEPVLPYDSVEALEDVAREAGISGASASLVGGALFGHLPGQGDRVLLRPHQAKALRDALKSGD